MMAYKRLGCKSIDDSYGEAYLAPDECGISHIREWNADVIEADPDLCGLSGSPTKVKKVENVVLTAGDVRHVPATEAGVKNLIYELISEKIIG